MGRAIFTRWLAGPHAAAEPWRRGVHVDERFASWASLAERGRALASASVKPGACCLVDPTLGHDSFVALLAVAQTPDTVLLWAKPDAVPLALEPRAPALYTCDERHGMPPGRPAYATATSGTSGSAKIPVAYGDVLELVALQYDVGLYQTAFEGWPEVGMLATCLPLEYAAVFMMTIVPSMFMARDLLIFPNHRWDLLYAAASREHVACLTVPALAAAACAATPEPVELDRAALVFTAGFLSRSRSERLREKLRGVTLLGSYGASETGVMTLDREPGGSLHVGRPLAGKPVWIIDAGEDGVGKIATTGPDCRERYWGSPERIPTEEAGIVASTDMGHFDDDGNLYLDGRIDGAQKFHGMLVYPRRIEAHILALPGVEDVRVRFDTSSGMERLEALVVGNASPEAVREHCRTLPEPCRPARVECRPDGMQAYSSRGKL